MGINLISQVLPAYQKLRFMMQATLVPEHTLKFYINKMYMMIVFILMNLLYSSACFEHYYAHLQEDNCIITASLVLS